MHFSRRKFLKAGAAVAGIHAVSPVVSWANSPDSLKLKAEVFKQRILASGPETEVWGFNGSVPGPLLRFRRGERVRIGVTNGLHEQGTTVHWHGLRVPNAMDGVPHVTQPPIAPGARFTYEYTVQDSGTFWYHPHQHSFEQVARGLYGPLIVEEERPIEVDREAIWGLSDFKVGSDNQQDNDFGHVRDMANMGRLGNVIALNGIATDADTLFSVRSGERIRLRLLNMASARIMRLRIHGHRPVVIAYDGQAVEPHEEPGGELALGPGMRIDLVLDCMGKPGQRFAVVDLAHKNRQLLTLAYSDESPLRQKPLGAPVSLPSNNLPEPDLGRAGRHQILFQGGMSGRPVIGLVDGKPVKIQELMEKHGLAWTMNFTARHESALTHVPFLRLAQGEHCLLSMINETGFEHPMHFHGHMFRVVAIEGIAPKYPQWRDTVLVGPRETVDIAFVADNPGEWMFHCHILEHAAGGMMGTIRVG